MKFKPTPKQALILWNLLITGEEPTKSKYRPADRDPLVQAKFIKLEPSQGRSQRITLTEKAWAWAGENFDIPPSNRPTQQERTLQALLIRVGAYLQTHDVSLADFIYPEVSEDEDDETPSIEESTVLEPDIEKRIRDACLEITGGQFNVRVLLSDLRQHLADLPREVVDKTLIAMQRSQKLALMPLDDPQSIKPADEQAAIDMGGNKRHIVYLEP